MNLAHQLNVIKEKLTTYSLILKHGKYNYTNTGHSIESTPNPNTLKFVTNKALLLNDMVEFQSVEETENAPLAKALFDC